MEALPVVLFVTWFIASVAAGEPRCSRFDYDEKTLEKMIRTEVKFEAVIADVKDFKELVKKDLEKVKAEKARMVQAIQTALADVAIETKKVTDEIQTALADVAVETKKMKDELQASLAEVAVERAKIKDEKQAAIEALKPTMVSFKAKRTSSGNVNRGDTLIFQDVISNHDNGYEAGKGMFRAPVGGVYLFTLQTCVHLKHYFVLETVIDDIVVSHATWDDYNNHICYDHTDLVTLAANSSINFRSGKYSNNNPVYIMVDSTARTTFIAGVLLIKE